MSADLEAVSAHLGTVRTWILDHPAGWRLLDGHLAAAVEQPLPPMAVLPIACAAAAGGAAADAVPVAAAWFVLNDATRILDDIQDRDNPAAVHERIGDARAFNLAAALYAHAQVLLDAAPWADDVHRRVARIFGRQAVRVAAGQDLDLRGPAPEVEFHWTAMAGKSGRAFALACSAGAAATGARAEAIAACERYGHHLGVILQVFDDIEGVWGYGGSDLESGRPGLPLAFALDADHPGRDELRSLVRDAALPAAATRARDLLDAAGTRSALLCAALEERDSALAALAGCRDPAGAAVLAAYVTAVFADVLEIQGEAAPPPGQVADSPGRT